MQFKEVFSSFDAVSKSIPLTPGVYLITTKIDMSLNNLSNSEFASLTVIVGDNQTIASGSLSAGANENKSGSSFSFAQLATVTDADCKIHFSGPGLESGATSASAIVYVCAERL